MMEKRIIIDDQLTLPNAVGVLDDGQIVVADGGNDRVCLFDSDGSFVKSTDGKGYGKYRLKEPVALSVSPENEIFVADWHNHRIVVYTGDLSYVTEFGYYGVGDYNNNAGKLKNILKFYKKLSTDGTYTRYFFSNKSKNNKEETSISVRTHIFVQAFHYWTFIRNTSPMSSIYKINNGGCGVLKPNGVTFASDNIYITQKNAKRISIYKRKENKIDFQRKDDIKKPKECVSFGRLGNIHASKFHDWIYVCDEREGLIWILDYDGGYLDDIEWTELCIESFLPFSCVEFEKDKIAVCSATELLIIDIFEKKIISRITTGELHGIITDQSNDYLYVVERSTDRILKYLI